MDIKHLKYFVEVARRRSFSKAAAGSFVAQSTVSKMIRDLEIELGAGLFNRSSKYVELTAEGETLFLQAEKVVELFDNISDTFKDNVFSGQGKINIGLPPITGVTDFARLLGQFACAYPKIAITLFEYGSKKVELGIQDGSLDVGVVCSPTTNELYEQISFSKDPLEIIMHRQNPLSTRTAVDFRDLRNESFVLYRHDFSLYDAIINRCKAAGFTPQIIFETSQRELMTQTVAANLGIALLPARICASLGCDDIMAVPLKEPVFLQMSIIWNGRRYLSTAARLWVEFARDYLQRNEKEDAGVGK